VLRKVRPFFETDDSTNEGCGLFPINTKSLPRILFIEELIRCEPIFWNEPELLIPPNGVSEFNVG
jgi:hypothetical protein